MTTSRTKCTLYFKKYIPTAAEFILSKGETEELKFDDTTDKNLRYIGANPNNYVSFNNELWRIIGVFNNINDGTGKKEARVKMIRKDPYGEDETNWDSEMINDWTQASLQEELNGTFLNSIQSPYKEMIGDALWNLGGMTKFYMGSSDGLASHWYTNERGTNVYTGRPTEWTGKIGLIYTSDYGYATSGGSTTDRTTCLNTAIYSWNDSSVSDCIDNDWLYFSDSYWFLTQHLIMT